jgi:hypothetical protein
MHRISEREGGMVAKVKQRFVPSIESSLLKRLHAPDNFFLGATTENIERFNALLNSVPPNYTWDFLTADAFKELSGSLAKKTPDAKVMIEIYRLYWHDMLGQIEAFSVMNAWRLGEIARSTVWALRRNDVICAAVMSRAALETAAAYAWLQTEIRPALDMVGAADGPMVIKYDDQGVIKDLEDKLVRVVYASKLKGEEPFYNPTNIVTIIEKIAKRIPHQEPMADAYYLLCEVAHPNWAGRSIYITNTKLGHSPGHEYRTISRSHGTDAHVILQASVTALSWATGTFSSSCVALQAAISNMAGHLKRISD